MNMPSRFLTETAVALFLVIFLVWFANPLGFWMTDAFHMTLLGLVVTLFAIFAMFLWKEGAADEREQLILFIATRFAYAAGGVVLLIGIVVQAFSHTIDPWMPFALTSMVLAKIVGRRFAGRHN